MKKALLLISVIGFIISIGIHLSTFFLSISLPKAFFLLNYLVTLVFSLVIVTIIKNKIQPRSDMFFSGCSKYLTSLTLLSLIYNSVNFILFNKLTNGLTPEIIENNYVLLSHGKVVEVINEMQYIKYTLLQFRMFSGFWMFFFILGATLLSLTDKKGKEDIREFTFIESNQKKKISATKLMFIWWFTSACLMLLGAFLNKMSLFFDFIMIYLGIISLYRPTLTYESQKETSEWRINKKLSPDFTPLFSEKESRKLGVFSGYFCILIALSDMVFHWIPLP